MASLQLQGRAAVFLGKSRPQCTKPTAVWGAHFDPTCSYPGTSLPNLAVQWSTGQAEPDIIGGEVDAKFIAFLALLGC